MLSLLLDLDNPKWWIPVNDSIIFVMLYCAYYVSINNPAFMWDMPPKWNPTYPYHKISKYWIYIVILGAGYTQFLMLWVGADFNLNIVLYIFKLYLPVGSIFSYLLSYKIYQIENPPNIFKTIWANYRLVWTTNRYWRLLSLALKPWVPSTDFVELLNERGRPLKEEEPFGGLRSLYRFQRLLLYLTAVLE